MARLDRVVQLAASDERAEEAARKRVTCAVRVDDLAVRERVDGEDLRDRRVVARHDRRALRAVGDDDGAGAGRVRLGLRRERLGDLAEVLLGRAGCAGPRFGLGLVADDNIAVGDDLLQLDTEELGDEGRGEVENEDLSLGRVSLARDY